MLHVHHLPNQAPDEELIFLLRRHGVVAVFEVFKYAFLAAFPWFVLFVLARRAPEALGQEGYQVIGFLLLVSFELFVWLLLYRAFVDYYLDVWIVTNKRIINIEQEDLFHRKFSEQKLFRVQDVTAVQKGLLAIFLNYGNVSIQTAAPQARFEFEQIPRPNEVARRITELVESDKKHHAAMTIP